METAFPAHRSPETMKEYGLVGGVRVSVDLVFKIAAIGVLVSVLAQVLSRAGRDDMAMLTTLTGLVIVLLMVANLVSDFFTSVKSIFNLY
jgi:stage III sporulation protein AC